LSKVSTALCHGRFVERAVEENDFIASHARRPLNGTLSRPEKLINSLIAFLTAGWKTKAENDRFGIPKRDII
jgi:hypothetical protein